MIVDLNKTEIAVKMMHSEMILELREFLNDHVNTCFYTNYFFEHAGDRLNDYTELAGLDFTQDNKIYMRENKYDERSVRQHVKRFIEILKNPPVLTS